MMVELGGIYGDLALSYDDKVSRREEIFTQALTRFDDEIAPTFEAVTFRGFRETSLNNATLLSRIRYYHRLPDFALMLEERGGDLAGLLAELRATMDTVSDPFDLLPESKP
jgi:hypothetical protein